MSFRVGMFFTSGGAKKDQGDANRPPRPSLDPPSPPRWLRAAALRTRSWAGGEAYTRRAIFCAMTSGRCAPALGAGLGYGEGTDWGLRPLPPGWRRSVYQTSNLLRYGLGPMRSGQRCRFQIFNLNIGSRQADRKSQWIFALGLGLGAAPLAPLIVGKPTKVPKDFRLGAGLRSDDTSPPPQKIFFEKSCFCDSTFPVCVI